MFYERIIWLGVKFPICDNSDDLKIIISFSIFNLNVAKLEASLKWMPKLMSEEICMYFDKSIVQSMFKHVAFENGPLVLMLQSYSPIFIVKHID